MTQNTSSAVMAQRVEPPDRLSLAQARALGLKWYFTGVPCKHGHVAKRTVSNRECRGCVNEQEKRRRRQNPEVHRRKDRERYWREVEKKRAQMRGSRKKHVEQRRAYDRDRYHTNPDRKAYQFRQANSWWKINKGKKNFMVVRRRAYVRQATPHWLSKDQKLAIREFYLGAANMDGEFHVDHIVPLRGKTVCGLNVPWNLQILTGDENREKSNAFE